MKIKDLVRAIVGTTHFYEYGSHADRKKGAVLIQSYATRSKAKLLIQQVDGFYSDHSPIYLLRVEVQITGQPKQKVGKKSKANCE